MNLIIFINQTDNVFFGDHKVQILEPTYSVKFKFDIKCITNFLGNYQS